MSLANWFNKPRWKNKDAAIRAAAVSTGDDTELLAVLPEIARNDPSAKVRAAATRRLDDLAILLEIATVDTDARVQKNARQRFVNLVEKLHENALEQHRDTLTKVMFSDAIQHLAEKAENKEVRRLFQEKIRSQGRLGDLLLIEKDTLLRQALANRLEKPATIQRVLKKLGKKDPALSALLQQQLQAKDPASQQKQLESQALALCEQLEKQVHGTEHSRTDDSVSSQQQRLNRIEQEWQALLTTATESELALPKTLEQRFTGALTTARLMADPQKRAAWLAEQKAQRAKKQARAALEAASHLWQQFQHNGSDISAEAAQKAEKALQMADMTVLSEEQQATARQLLADWPRLLSALKTSTTQPPTTPGDEAENLLARAQKALKREQPNPRELSRLRQQWAALEKTATGETIKGDTQKQFNHSMHQLAEKIEQQKQRRDEAARQAMAHIEQVDAAIKAGQLAEAKHCFNQHVQQKKIAGHAHPLIKRNKHRIDRTWNALKELRQWQKWSNDKVRQRLIDDLKATPTSGWHPDAILAKLKEGSAQWKALEEQEKLEGDRYPVRNTKLWNEFRALQDALFELAEPYLEQRSQKWDQNLEAVNQLLETLAAVRPEELETRELSSHVRQAIGWLKKLETLPPGERGRIAGSLREQINRLDQPLKARYAEAKQRKETLIEKSQALLNNEDLAQAIEQAKALQRQWKQAGFVPQSQERALWKRFRAAQDAVFNRLGEERKQAKAQQQAARVAADAFLNAIRTRLTEASSPETIKALIAELRSGWPAHQGSGLQRSFQKLEETLQSAAANFNQKQQLNSLALLKEAGEICAALEAGTVSSEQASQNWQEKIETALSGLGKATRSEAWQKQQARFQSLLATGSPAADSKSTETYLNTLIAAEFLTGGSDTPEEFQEQRNAYQIDRLARRMSGETLPDSVAEARQLLETLFTLERVDPATRQCCHPRHQPLENALFDLLRNP